MASPKTPVEIEIKLVLPDSARGRQILRRAGFKVARPRSLERNVVYDSADGRLQGQGLLVRLREYGGENLVTFKGPAKLSHGRRKGSLHRSRVEYESTVSNPAVLVEIWKLLGLEPRFRYEKYRTIFRRAADTGGVAMLDETPIGCFLELEGKGSWIDRIAGLLGYSPDDYLRESYVALHAADCAKRGVKFGDMVFGVRREKNTEETL